ncbi:RHS repeat-associated core domain-containing protein [Mangrovivirga cuniculi]|uniref:RHS repeat-associated core domain-containing protein n=1 Tax=Mangrovivirga cuniculi TaxID=2715131 RepID=UPI00158621F2|nr:RHS repeat-associated core domain-containing protein [Mangrovivirga cuniculi]
MGLELDQDRNIITYDEYHPFGTTAFRAENNAIEAKAKRYRYTGMEQDEESGLNYHTARYYLPWLGRWGSADPIGIEGGRNLYAYTNNNPIKLVDASGKQAYQRHFNRNIVDLIVASGNQAVIDRLLLPTDNGGYRFNTNRRSGFNAGHTVSGDRTSQLQELAIEIARTNQGDGTMERLNRGMAKSAVEVDIGNGIKIPVERFTARELELEGVLPRGSSELPAATGWTRAEFDSQVEAVRSGRPVPDTDARSRWSPDADVPTPTNPGSGSASGGTPSSSGGSSGTPDADSPNLRRTADTVEDVADSASPLLRRLGHILPGALSGLSYLMIGADVAQAETNEERGRVVARAGGGEAGGEVGFWAGCGAGALLLAETGPGAGVGCIVGGIIGGFGGGWAGEEIAEEAYDAGVNSSGSSSGSRYQTYPDGSVVDRETGRSWVMHARP